MTIYDYVKSGEIQEQQLYEAVKLSLDRGGNHTDADIFEWDEEKGKWLIRISESESYAIAELREALKSMGLDTERADALISGVWRSDDSGKPSGYGRVRIRLFEVALFLCDAYLHSGWDSSLSDRAKYHLAKLREIAGHLPKPHRVVSMSVAKTGWWLLEGTK